MPDEHLAGVAYYDDTALAWRCGECDAVVKGDGDCPRCDADDDTFGRNPGPRGYEAMRPSVSPPAEGDDE